MLFGSDLQRMVDRVRVRWLISGKSPKELRVSQHELILLYGGVCQDWIGWILNKLGRIGKCEVGEWICHKRNQVSQLGSRVAFDLRPEVVEGSGIGKVKVCTFLSDIVHV